MAGCSWFKVSRQAVLQALAREAGAGFINIRGSSLQSKWFGESQKLTQAVFTLAYKLQPCIIFVGGPLVLHFASIRNANIPSYDACLQPRPTADEAESMLGHRRSGEHEAVSSMKTEFMQLWDGFNTDPSANIMVLAATNRPYDLDEAVLRRCGLMPESVAANLAILQIALARLKSCSIQVCTATGSRNA